MQSKYVIKSIDFIYRLVYIYFMEENNNKNNVLQSALALFSERGYENVGVQELVTAAGITKPTLYYYFGNKEGVLKEILNHYYDMLNTILGSASIYMPKPSSYFEDVYPVLVKITITYFNFAQVNKLFYRMALTMQYLPPTSQTAMYGKEYHNKQFEIIENLFSEISNVHPNMKNKEQRYTRTFIGMINTYIGLWYDHSIALSVDVAAEAVKQFMHGIFN